MPTYAGPRSYSKKTAELSDRADTLRKQVDDGADAQRVNKVFGQFTDEQKAAVKAIDHNLNNKEAEAEALDQRIADEYPAGTTVDGRKSRNKAKYGEPQKLANGGAVGGPKWYGKKAKTK